MVKKNQYSDKVKYSGKEYQTRLKFSRNKTENS